MAQDGPKMSPTGPQDGPRWPPESWAIKQIAARSARGSRARVAARTKCRRNTIRLMSITFVATTRMFFARHVAKGHSGQRNVASNVAVSVEYTRACQVPGLGGLSAVHELDYATRIPRHGSDTSQ